jgi:hypothetical protein
MQDVTRDRDEIRLGTSDGLMAFDAHKAQEHIGFVAPPRS